MLEETSLSIRELLDDTEYGLGVSLLAGERGLVNRIYSSRIQKPGLALAGYTTHLHPDRIQVLGNTEISYLDQIDDRLAIDSIRTLCTFPISCFIITKGLVPPRFFLDAVEEA